MYSQHLKVARIWLGISDDKLGAIKGWATSDAFTDLERAVDAGDRRAGRARNLVEDETFRRAEEASARRTDLRDVLRVTSIGLGGCMG